MANSVTAAQLLKRQGGGKGSRLNGSDSEAYLDDPRTRNTYVLHNVSLDVLEVLNKRGPFGDARGVS